MKDFARLSQTGDLKQFKGKPLHTWIHPVRPKGPTTWRNFITFLSGAKISASFAGDINQFKMNGETLTRG